MLLKVLKNTVLLLVVVLIACGSGVEKKEAPSSEILNNPSTTLRVRLVFRSIYGQIKKIESRSI